MITKKVVPFSFDKEIVSEIQELYETEKVCDNYKFGDNLSRSEFVEGLVIQGLRELKKGKRFHLNRNLFLMRTSGTEEAREREQKQ